MDESQEMPRLAALMSDEEPDIFTIIDEFPPRKNVVIRVSVTNEETGEVVESVHYESPQMWERGYRQFYKGRIIRKVAEDVADEVDRNDVRNIR